MRFTHLVMVGCGGTGSILVEPLVRLLAYHKNGCRRTILIDGDKFEEKNLARQLFDPKHIGKNKAEVTAERIANICKTTAIKSFIDKEAFLVEMVNEEGFIKGSPLVVLSVDNHASRKAVILAMDEMKIENFVVLLPGNELDFGRCSVYAKSGGVILGAHPFELYETIKNPTDRIPGGCAKEAPSTPQLVSANFGAAFSSMLLVQALLDHEKWFPEIHFNCRNHKLVGQGAPFKEDPMPEEPKVEKKEESDVKQEEKIPLPDVTVETLESEPAVVKD